MRSQSGAPKTMFLQRLMDENQTSKTDGITLVWSRSNLREFVRTAAIVTPAREASRVGTALRRQDPMDPQECSFLLEFETPIEVERSEARI